MDATFTARPARTADIAFLWEMLHESIHVEPGESRPPRETLQTGPLAHYLAGWGRQGDRAVIAEQRGDPVGAAWFRLLPAHDRGYGYVADDIPELGLAVRQEWRRKGVGTLLLTELIARARADGYRGLSLSVDPRNRAVRLYERLSFAYVATDDGGSWTMLKRFPTDTSRE